MTCKGVPTDTCEFCHKVFSSAQSKSNHRKICKSRNSTLRPANVQNNPKSTSQPTIVINQYNDNRTYIGQQNNILQTPPLANNVFGHEDLTDILRMMEEEPRIRDVVSNFKNALAMVYFNKDFPQNQTVRKMNKKSNTIELRHSVDPERWNLEPFETGYQKVINNIERRLKVDVRNDQPIPLIRDQVYQLSKIEPNMTTSEISAPPRVCEREPEKEGTRERLHQIANEEREAFLSGTQRIEVKQCETFKRRLHEVFRRQGLMYEVVPSDDSPGLIHLFRYLSRKSPELDYALCRVWNVKKKKTTHKKKDNETPTDDSTSASTRDGGEFARPNTNRHDQVRFQTEKEHDRVPYFMERHPSTDRRSVRTKTKPRGLTED